MKRRTAPSKATAAKLDSLHEEEVELADGRRLSPGVEFTLHGGGRFVFRYRYTRDGSLAAYGPVGSPRAKLRSFTEDRVRTVHRSKEARS